MTTNPKTNHLLRVAITFKQYYAALLSYPASTTLYFTNQQIKDGSIYYPVLLSAGAWGVSSINAIPESVETEVVLSNARGSLGFERRVSDLFRKYNIHNQDITLSYALTDPDSTATVTWTEMWSAKAIGWAVNIGVPDTLTIQVSSVGIPQRKMTRTLRSSDFTYIPDASVGVDLPLVFGGHDSALPDDPAESIYIRPVCCDVNNNECEYAYATTLASSFKNKSLDFSGSSAVHFKNNAFTSNGRQITEWTRAKLIATGTEGTPVVNSGTTLAGSANPYWDDPNRFSAYGEEITTASNNYVISGCKVKFRSTGDTNYLNGATTTDARLRASIYQDDFSGLPATEIAFGEALWADYLTDLRNASTSNTFDVHVKFNNLVHLGGISGMKYFIIISQTTTNVEEGTLTYDLVVQANRAGTSNQVVFGKSIDFEVDTDGDSIGDITVGSDQFVRVYNRTDLAPIWSLYGLSYVHNQAKLYDATTDGLGMSTIYFKYYDNQASATGPDLSNLDMLFEVTGLIDDGSGTITGTASLPITKPTEILKILGMNYNESYPTVWGGSSYGDKWLTLDSSTYDYTCLDSTTNPFYRRTHGYIEGPINLDELLAEFCREMGTKIIRRNNATAANRYTVWVYGGNKAPVTTFTDDNSRILSITCLGFETIINHVKFYYLRDVRQLDLLRAGQAQEFREYKKVLDLRYGSTPEANDYTGYSYSNFGYRQNSVNDYNLIGDSSTAAAMFRQLAGQYAFPNVYVTIETPYAEFAAYEGQQIAEILHTDYTSFWGTSPLAGYYSYNGAAVDISPEVTPRMAERQRCVIEGKEIYFDSGGAPFIKWTVRAITNEPFEPT